MPDVIKGITVLGVWHASSFSLPRTVCAGALGWVLSKADPTQRPGQFTWEVILANPALVRGHGTEEGGKPTVVRGRACYTVGTQASAHGDPSREAVEPAALRVVGPRGVEAGVSLHHSPLRWPGLLLEW